MNPTECAGFMFHRTARQNDDLSAALFAQKSTAAWMDFVFKVAP
jgi:hypothetical protein